MMKYICTQFLLLLLLHAIFFTSSHIQDILPLKITDIEEEIIVIYESKLQTRKSIIISSRLKPYLTVYLNGYRIKRSNLLFCDEQGRMLTYPKVLQVLNIVAKKVNLPDVYLYILS